MLLQHAISHSFEGQLRRLPTSRAAERFAAAKDALTGSDQKRQNDAHEVATLPVPIMTQHYLVEATRSVQHCSCQPPDACATEGCICSLTH